jgi:hypothetical protein
MSSIDPYFVKRGKMHAMGTVDFMSPEMAGGKVSHDPDGLTYLYVSLKRSNPEAAQQLAPAISAFRRFHSAMLQAVSQIQIENVEMQVRLDLQSVKKMRQAVERLRESVSRFSPQELNQSDQKLRQAIQLFQPFYTAFNRVIGQVEQSMATKHQSVKHLAWDTTRYR